MHGLQQRAQKGNAKLTPDRVVEVRVLRAESDLTGRRIAEMFGVCVRTVRRICNGDAWLDVGGPICVPYDDGGLPPLVDASEWRRCAGCGCKCRPSVSRPDLCLRCSLQVVERQPDF